jgi:hypothetical protein
MRIVVNVLFTELIRVLVFFATADLALFVWDLIHGAGTAHPPSENSNWTILFQGANSFGATLARSSFMGALLHSPPPAAP